MKKTTTAAAKTVKSVAPKSAAKPAPLKLATNPAAARRSATVNGDVTVGAQQTKAPKPLTAAELKAAKLTPAAKPAAESKPKPATVTKLVAIACSKCGRENNRPAGADNGDCRVASACSARKRRAAEPKPAKGKTAKPAAKPAPAAAPVARLVRRRVA